jgi:hypothetical protein
VISLIAEAHFSQQPGFEGYQRTKNEYSSGAWNNAVQAVSANNNNNNNNNIIVESKTNKIAPVARTAGRQCLRTIQGWAPGHLAHGIDDAIAMDAAQ